MFSGSDMAFHVYAAWFSSCLKGKRFELFCLPFRSTLTYLTSQGPKEGDRL